MYFDVKTDYAPGFSRNYIRKTAKWYNSPAQILVNELYYSHLSRLYLNKLLDSPGLVFMPVKSKEI